ncbi:MAG: DMT family transporter [Quadrisphaera sp.]
MLSQRWSRAAAAGALPPAPRPLTMTAWQLTLSGLLVAPVAALAEGAPPALDGAGLAGLAFLSLVATALAYAAWFTGLARAGRQRGLRHRPAQTPSPGSPRARCSPGSTSRRSSGRACCSSWAGWCWGRSVVAALVVVPRPPCRQGACGGSWRGRGRRVGSRDPAT